MSYQIKRCHMTAPHDPHPWGEPVKRAALLQYSTHCPGTGPVTEILSWSDPKPIRTLDG